MTGPGEEGRKNSVPGEAMRISFNGKPVEIEDGSTVDSLLSKFGVKKELVVVELNLKILDKNGYPAIVLSPDDKVECISFMAGG